MGGPPQIYFVLQGKTTLGPYQLVHAKEKATELHGKKPRSEVLILKRVGKVSTAVQVSVDED